MGHIGLTNLILIILSIALVSFAWLKFKREFKQRDISVYVYILLLGIIPILSFILMYKLITIPHLDFFGYIFVIIFAECVFLSFWVFTALNGEYKKVQLSMHVVLGVVLFLLMTVMVFIEILPSSILETFLEPITSIGIFYDMWSRPPYQLAHFIIYVFTFPYIASFVIGKGILMFRSNEVK